MYAGVAARGDVVPGTDVGGRSLAGVYALATSSGRWLRGAATYG